MSDEELAQRFSDKLTAISAEDGSFTEQTAIEFMQAVHERDASRDQQIALAVQEKERQYTWDFINAIRYRRTTLEKARSEALERLSTTQVEIDMVNLKSKQDKEKH